MSAPGLPSNGVGCFDDSPTADQPFDSVESSRQRSAVDGDKSVLDFNCVTRKSNDAFNHTDSIDGIIEDDDVATIRFRDCGNRDRGEGKAELIRCFVDDDSISDMNRGLHGAGRDVVLIGKAPAEGEKTDGEN